ncbi:hypothetical protein V474_02180 [Novosphingobium barchaimii LL02]|uniref:Alpha/beta hydrolase fold-3 domain-containing protein n=1 Tax=Novosphingobium barchaimii LL02 TaxID=1114963 RepID=A0A0J7XIL6_9SPHN|nr:hypothetical protein [Novosphingobium barchaimii]KMS51871.1 hypothetical protein V474_02180 [Novosphingobium barchaimii LL02]
MSRHLVDPELAVGFDNPLTQDLSNETLPGYRTKLEAMVAAIPKPVSVELHVWPGAFHAFGVFDAHVARKARRVARTAIKGALHGGVSA